MKEEEIICQLSVRLETSLKSNCIYAFKSVVNAHKSTTAKTSVAKFGVYVPIFQYAV